MTMEVMETRILQLQQANNKMAEAITMLMKEREEKETPLNSYKVGFNV